MSDMSEIKSVLNTLISYRNIVMSTPPYNVKDSAAHSVATRQFDKAEKVHASLMVTTPESVEEARERLAGPDVHESVHSAPPRSCAVALSLDADPALGAVRREVAVMAHAMEYKLRENDHKPGWEGVSIEKLLELLRGEVKELEEAISRGNFIDIILEAADVANYAMMIAWNSMKGKVK